MKTTPLFICAANVGRSQMAEGIFNHLHGEGSSFSCAGGEAKKEKYNGKPADSIIELVRDRGGIDITNQKIKYLSDISEDTLARVNRVIFLFDPKAQATCDSDCRVHGLTPYEYLQSRNFTIDIHYIPDPHEESNDKWPRIYDMIRNVIENI